MSEIKLSTTKRLIVCCDGTWQDATADADQPPSNVTRIARALSRAAYIEEDGKTCEIPQIIYYQKGVGTNIGDKYFGGVTGAGLSANVRAAYAFLTENYDPGDKIYFFGFSRGAYTARAIAGLVLDLGLLTPRGMDNFTNVYDDFYNKQKPPYSAEEREKLGFRPPLPRFTVEIIGVWDTVGFHKTWIGKYFGEKLEFRNTILSRDVRYAFHALALDEERTAYQPTLWHQPANSEGQELLQVWFSGVHTDAGGGGQNPRLANITLAWMIAQCSKNDQLSFDVKSYLFDEPPLPLESASAPWATALGKTPTESFTRTMERILGGTSKRTPLAYPDPDATASPTNEMIHVSINDRVFVRANSKAGKVLWPCAVLKGQQDSNDWGLVDGHVLKQAPLLDTELMMKGRIRTVHVNKTD